MGRKNRNIKKRLREEKKKEQRKTRISRTKIESTVAHFLDNLGIVYRQNQNIGRFNVDFLVDDKYIIECYGNFWHCNPQKYPPDFYNRGLKCEAHERWNKDQKRQEELESLGYQFLALWENEIQNAPKLCKIKVMRLLNSNYKSPLD